MAGCTVCENEKREKKCQRQSFRPNSQIILSDSRQFSSQSHLKQVDDHDDVRVRGQGSLERAVDTPALGPVLDQNHELLEPGIDLRVKPEQRGVLHCQEVVDANVALDGSLRLDELDNGNPGLGDGKDLGHPASAQETCHLLHDLLLGRPRVSSPTSSSVAVVVPAGNLIPEVLILAVAPRVVRGVRPDVDLDRQVDVVVLTHTEVVRRRAEHVKRAPPKLLVQDPLNLLEALVLHLNLLLCGEQGLVHPHQLPVQRLGLPLGLLRVSHAPPDPVVTLVAPASSPLPPVLQPLVRLLPSLAVHLGWRPRRPRPCPRLLEVVVARGIAPRSGVAMAHLKTLCSGGPGQQGRWQASRPDGPCRSEPGRWRWGRHGGGLQGPSPSASAPLSRPRPQATKALAALLVAHRPGAVASEEQARAHILDELGGVPTVRRSRYAALLLLWLKATEEARTGARIRKSRRLGGPGIQAQGHTRREQVALGLRLGSGRWWHRHHGAHEGRLLGGEAWRLATRLLTSLKERQKLTPVVGGGREPVGHSAHDPPPRVVGVLAVHLLASRFEADRAPSLPRKNALQLLAPQTNARITTGALCSE